MVARPHVPTSSLRVSVARTFGDLDALLPEWAQLFYASGAPNPFAHPLWMTTWAHHFVAPGDLYVLTVRDARDALCGVAPFYRCRRCLPGLTLRRLRLLGSGPHWCQTELPQVLALPGEVRRVLAHVVRHIGEHAGGWDWVEIALAHDQGWFLPHWLPRHAGNRGLRVMHTATQPYVVLRLPSTWAELRTRLGRNVKESIRRGANRLARDGHAWKVVAPANVAELDAAMDRVLALHRARASLLGRPRHAIYFDRPADVDFLRDAARRLFAAGHLTPYLLRVGDAVAAGHVVLHANGASFFSISGFDPAWWQYSVATTLTAECLRLAIDRGDSLANLSTSPDTSKLRWSEEVRTHEHFVVYGPRFRSRLAFRLSRLIDASALFANPTTRWIQQAP